MNYLWNKPEHDPQLIKANWLSYNTDPSGEFGDIGKDYRALCTVYADVFGNGGQYLPLPGYQGLIQRLRACGRRYNLQTPQFCEVTDEIINGAEVYEVIERPEMEKFARDLIDHLYATVDPEGDIDV